MYTGLVLAAQLDISVRRAVRDVAIQLGKLSALGAS